MPDKIYGCRKEKGCPRCWRNRLLHSCPMTKRWIKNHPEFVLQMKNNQQRLWCAWGGMYYKKVSTSKDERKKVHQEEIDNPELKF